jgi:hypothetical protein
MHGEIIHHALQGEFPPSGISPKLWLKNYLSFLLAFYHPGQMNFLPLCKVKFSNLLAKKQLKISQ